ncbi:hypothetical protein CBM2634_B170268 [Cupriavidus taiwanensis]|uniref:Uncharacterized protein n=1 Tax=Cupriavidus taiwanensis TaxID=164546 RepID=A0A375J8N0_9BURK|nr:hypothetical protein CBM2634_B170268 [Cupriavidus taiwanensis]
MGIPGCRWQPARGRRGNPCLGQQCRELYRLLSRRNRADPDSALRRAAPARLRTAAGSHARLAPGEHAGVAALSAPPPALGTARGVPGVVPRADAAAPGRLSGGRRGASPHCAQQDNFAPRRPRKCPTLKLKSPAPKKHGRDHNAIIAAEGAKILAPVRADPVETTASRDLPCPRLRALRSAIPATLPRRATPLLPLLPLHHSPPTPTRWCRCTRRWC